MALLSSYRRPWALAVFGVLLIPLAGLLVSDRFKAAASFPQQWWHDPSRKLAPAIDANFGFRDPALTLYGRYRHALRSPPTRQVFYGKDNQLFYGQGRAVQQSTGSLFRKKDMDRFIGMGVMLNDVIAGYGGRLIVGSPPNAQTSLAHLLPNWAKRPENKALEYDYVFNGLARAGIKTVDLRLLIETAQRDSPVYLQTDTHWNNRGALLAFNAIMEHVGRRDLKIAPSEALDPTQVGSGGDLAIFLSLSSVLKDPFYVPWKLEMTARTTVRDLVPLPGHDWNYAFETPRDGASILVIGDSFTAMIWRPLLERVARRVHWVHMQGCRSNWEEARKLSPEIVIILPTERHLGCRGSAWPKGLPRVSSQAGKA